MGRVYIHPLGLRKNCNYSKDSLDEAINELLAGRIKMKSAITKYKIPKTTLLRHLQAKRVGNKPLRKYGGQPVLSEIEENKLVDGINVASKWGYPFEPTDIRYLVKSYLDGCGRKEKRFTDNLPGMEWFFAFMKRHKKKLSIRTPGYIKLSRAQIGKPEVAEFFRNLQETIAHVPPENIMNFDESAFVDDPGKTKVIVRRGARRVENIMDTSKSSTSVMFAGTASGLVMPPFIVFKAKDMWTTWMEGGPPYARYRSNKSGWFDTSIFCDWFSTVALPYLKRLPGKKVIIGDNVSSHLSMDVIQLCKEYDIAFILFPPNCTHLLQPLDVVFFRQLKPKWREVLKKWKLKNNGAIPKDQFGKLLFKAMKDLGIYPDLIPPGKKYFESKYLASSFEQTGIYPFNPSKVLKRMPNVGAVDDEEAVEAYWTASLENYIKEQRFSSSRKAPRRRKKIQTAPGKSVTAEVETSESEIDDNVEPSNENSEQLSDSEKSDINDFDQSDVDQPDADSSNSEDVDDSEQSDIEEPNANSSNPKNADDSQCTSDGNVATAYEPGTFVLVVYGKRQFVGQIIRVNTEVPVTLHTKFLRPYQNRANEYHFPDIDDFDDIIPENILKILFPPKIVRGKYTFYDM